MIKQKIQEAIANYYQENPDRFENEFTIATPEHRQTMDAFLSRLRDPGSWKPHTKDDYFYIDMSDLNEHEYHLDRALMGVDEDNNGEPYVKGYTQEIEHADLPGMSRRDFRNWLESNINEADPYPDAHRNGEMKKASDYEPGDYFRVDIDVDDEYYPYTLEDVLVMKVRDQQEGTLVASADYDAENEIMIDKNLEVPSFLEGSVADERGMEAFFVMLNKRSQDEAFDILMEVFKSELAWFRSRFIVRSDQDRWEVVRHCKNIMKYDHLWEWEDDRRKGDFFFPDAEHDRTIRWNGAGFLYARFFYDENDKIIGLMMSVA